jgi:hypothetical protein
MSQACQIRAAVTTGPHVAGDSIAGRDGREIGRDASAGRSPPWSRDHGKSGDRSGGLTYEPMTDDVAALIDQVKAGPVQSLNNFFPNTG